MQHISSTDNLHHLCSSVLQFPWFNFTALKSSATNLQSLFIDELSISYSTSTNFFMCNTHTRNRKLHFLPCVARATLYNKPPTGYPHGCTYPSGSWGAPPQQSTPGAEGNKKETPL